MAMRDLLMQIFPGSHKEELRKLQDGEQDKPEPTRTPEEIQQDFADAQTKQADPEPETTGE